jgi:hypothetical protein
VFAKRGMGFFAASVDGSDSQTAAEAIVVVCVLGGLSVISAVVIAIRLNRRLRREVGSLTPAVALQHDWH